MNADIDKMSVSSEVSYNTDIKVFKPNTDDSPKDFNYKRKASTEQKVDSTQPSTLKTEKERRDRDNFLFLKEERPIKKKILNQKVDSILEMKSVAVEDDEIDSYSIKSDKVEEFPLSFRPTGRGFMESNTEVIR